MDKEEEKKYLEIVESWRKRERRAVIKFCALVFVGCVAVIVGSYCLGKYIVEHKPVPTVYCNKQTYNGHDYLFLSSGNPGEKGVVHDPDCACHKSAENRQSPAKIKNTDGKRYLLLPTVKETSTGMVSSISTR